VNSAPRVEQVAAIARRLLDDGYVRYEIDAWRTAVQLIAAHDQLRHEEDRDGRAGFSQR
jgi:hypothetical protein